MKTPILLAILLVAGAAPVAQAETLPPLFKSGAAHNSDQEVVDEMASQLLKQNQDSLVLQSALDLAEKYRGKGYEPASAVMVVKNLAFDPFSIQPEELASAGDFTQLRLKPYQPISDFFGRMIGDPAPKDFVAFFKSGEIVLVGRLNKLDRSAPTISDKSLVVRITVAFTSRGGRNVPFDNLLYKLESVTIEEHDGTVIPQGGASTAGH